MQRYWGLRGSRIIWAALFLIVFPAYTCFGFNQAVAGGVLTLESFVGTFPAIDTINTSGAQESHNSTIQGELGHVRGPPFHDTDGIICTGTVIALFVLGAAFGALTCIKCGDWLGRRMTIFCAALIATIGAILMASSFSLAQLIVSRLVLGFGSGGYTATIPVW